MDRIGVRELDVLDLLRRLALADDAGEVLFGRLRRVLPVRPADDEAGERELRLSGSSGRSSDSTTSRKYSSSISSGSRIAFPNCSFASSTSAM